MKREKINQQGLAPIYARIKSNGLKIEVTTSRRIAPIHWFRTTESAFATTKFNRELNQYLETFKSKIYQAYTSVLSSGEGLTAESLRKELFPEPKRKRHMLIETAMQHNEQFEKLIGVKFSKGTFKNYKTTVKYLHEFLPLQYKAKDIYLDQLDYAFCEGFYVFLITNKACHNNGACKQLQRIKKFVNYAIRAGYLVTSPMASYPLEFKQYNRTALSMTELNKLESLIIQRRALEQVRDIFVFMCYTGLAYVDIKRLESKHIELDEKGDVWLKMERQKTAISFSVPLLKPAVRIMQEYWNLDKKDGLLFPVLCNQRMNDALKLLQELAGIEKRFTTHLGRHTFATTITLNNNVPMETVSKMLGHTNIRTTQIYAKVLTNKIDSDMTKLRDMIK